MSEHRLLIKGRGSYSLFTKQQGFQNIHSQNDSQREMFLRTILYTERCTSTRCIFTVNEEQ